MDVIAGLRIIVMDIEKDVCVDLVSNTRRILKLEENELRVTDTALICKNPNYSLCDAMLSTDTVYSLEYLLSYWECRSGRCACFVFKNTGCRVSLSCYVGFPDRLRNLKRVTDFNLLSINESLLVTLNDIERIKPCDKGILTNCVVRKSNNGLAYNIEVIAFGPENESEYEALLRDIYIRSVNAVNNCSETRSFSPRFTENRNINTRRWAMLRKQALFLARKRYQLRAVDDGGYRHVNRAPYFDRLVVFFTKYAIILYMILIFIVSLVLFVTCIVYWNNASYAKSDS